jgi:hypothetical protein
MKKSIIIVVVLVIIAAVAWAFTRGGMSGSSTTDEATATTTTAANPTTVAKVSSTLSSYRNDELGFMVDYPSTWTYEGSASGVTFTVPTKVPVVATNTISKLAVDVNFFPGACTFPQVTTIKEKSSIKVKDTTFNMIAISNAVQGRQYFNRMYSTPKGSVCYMFNFSSITSDPSTKTYSAADITKINATNKATIDAADTAFQTVVKSFQFVSTPDGDNEALHSK